jgi:toxin ParE1/3/4
MGAALRVDWTPTSTQNLRSAWEYIARDSGPSAERLMERIFEAVEKLGEYPRMGRSGRVPGTHELVISGTPYVVAYRVGPKHVQVLAVFHGATRWPATF